MTWKAGQSGNPNGRKTNKLITDAIKLALTEEHEATGKKKLRVLAEKLVDEAIAGNVQAMKEVADRMEGKPAQSVDLGGQADNPILAEILVSHVPADNGKG